MASQQDWAEFNGANAATKTDSVANANWKSLDDNTTAYSAAADVIVAGNNSMAKYQALRFFGGGWNNLSAFTYKLSTLNPLDSASGASTHCVVAASVLTTATIFTTPSTTATGDPTTTAGFTNGTGVSAGFAASTGPLGAGASTDVAAATIRYANALRTQLQTVAAAAPGDIATVTITATWTES